MIRIGNVITFEHTDDLRETGLIDGTEFTARSATQTMFFPTCADGTVLSGTFEATVTGRFSADGRRLTGNEVWAYHFSSGEITMSMDWSAAQR